MQDSLGGVVTMWGYYVQEYFACLGGVGIIFVG